ncbi:MAG: LacI family transcriptional regulator [Opitutaceae bacterium]|jgi:LacI family transcriptional regulator|nr:LacI family transcriptional regulator [Opitutaceae bacterium]
MSDEKSSASPSGSAGKSVSMGDIARIAGVSRMSVSCALRNQPGVGAERRSRILEIATALGYIPDARMNSLMQRVRETKTKDLVPIAWLNTDSESRDCWRSYPYLSPYFEGAEVRCRELGYRLDQFWTYQPGMSNRRISQIFYQRGIQGVIVAPPDRVHLGRIRFNWRHFSSATFERGITAPRLSRVSQDFYYNTMLALKMLRRFGYRRIGVLVCQQTDRRAWYAHQAATWCFQSRIPSSEHVPPLMHTERNVAGDDFHAWLHNERPDVVVGQHSRLVEWIRAAGHRVPEDIGVIHMALEDDCADWAGIWARKREIGAAAVELVISQLHTHQTGIPSVRHEIMIPGDWHPGRTLIIPKTGRH